MELKGSSITYGVTMLKAAANPEVAEAFLAYLLDENGGLKVLKEQGQPPIVPPSVATAAMHDALPQALKAKVRAAE